MAYPTECPSVEAFVQRVVNLSSKGYYYFFLGDLPEGKGAAAAPDRKMVSKYCLEKIGCRALTKAKRSRRRARGYANIDCFRFGCGFVVMATEGRIVMALDDPDEFLDLREHRLVFGDYQLSIAESGFTKGGAPMARIRTELTEVAFKEVRKHFVAVATRHKAGYLQSEFYNLPYNCYRGIRVQLRSILDEVNQLRRRKGQRKLSAGCIRFKRDLPKHFASVSSAQRAA